MEADEAYHGKRETPVELSRGRVRKPTKLGVDDSRRALIAIQGAEGKRLLYRGPRAGQDA